MRSTWLHTVLVGLFGSLTAGCGFQVNAGASDASDGGTIDTSVTDSSSIDASSVDASPDPVCFGTGLVTECVATTPSGATVLQSMTIDTSTSPLCAVVVAGGNTDACVIAGQSIQIQGGGTIRGIGTRPLVFIAETTIMIDGVVDVASRRVDGEGAAADWASCGVGTPATKGGSGGGGYGGSFGGKGGNGLSNEGGNGGIAAAAIPSPVVLHGGCPGGNGGGSQSSHGHGGGAVYFIAKTSITITGSVNASGAGGGGGSGSKSGGGGGGSGGMIGLDAPTILIMGSGKVFANGGGGGGGAGDTNNRAGGESTNGAVATGAGSSGDGGGGGNGSQGATLNGANSPSNFNSGDGAVGGAGGSAGVIKRYGATLTNTGLVSPLPS